MKTILELLLIFIISILTRVAVGQPWYFNNLYNPNHTWSAGLSIVADSSGSMACAVSGDTYNYYQICIQKLSHDGILTNFMNYGEYGMDYYPGENGSFKNDGQNGFYLFGSIDYFNYIVKGLFIYFDINGDTIFSRKYESFYTTRLAGRNCGKTSDNGFILTGDENITDSSGVDCYLIKIDSTGTEQWRKHHGMNIGDVPYSIIQTPDLGYAIGGLTFSGSQITYDPLLIKTDSLGELVWMLNLGGEFKDDKAMVCNTEDSCIMVLTAYADSMYTPEHAFTKINLVKIDLEGNIIWNKKYGPSKRVNYISNVSNSQNENYILCGYSELPWEYFSIAGWIMEVNWEGDSLWYKDLFYYPPDVDFPYNALYDISITEDHGFIATGQAFTLDPPNNVQKMWVIKVDSVGCEIPNCWVGIEEKEGMEAGVQRSFEIWPNPASGLINVRLSMVDVGRLCKNLELEIYDMFGREIRKIIIPETDHEIQINVENFPQGLYLVVYKEGSKVIGSSKMIISR